MFTFFPPRATAEVWQKVMIQGMPNSSSAWATHMHTRIYTMQDIYHQPKVKENGKNPSIIILNDHSVTQWMSKKKALSN